VKYVTSCKEIVNNLLTQLTKFAYVTMQLLLTKLDMGNHNENRKKRERHESRPTVQDGISKESFTPQEVQKRGVVVTDDIPDSDESDAKEVHNEELDRTQVKQNNPDEPPPTSEDELIEKVKRQARPRSKYGFVKH
jgi:hypothetical protein